MERGVRFYTLSLIAATIAGLGLAELAIRVLDPVRLFAVKNDLVQISPNPALMYTLNPEHPEHNDQGFRSPVDYSPAKPAGAFRIAIVGGSATYGIGSPVGEAFPEQLERLLNERATGAGSARQFEVLNFGIPGYSLVQELELLRTKVSGFAPDMVILAVCLDDWGPYSGTFLHPLIENQALGGLLIDYLDPGNGILRQILFNSHLYRRLLLLANPYGSGPAQAWRNGNPIVEFYAGRGNWYGERFRRFQDALRGHRVQSVVALLPARAADLERSASPGRLPGDAYDEKLAELGTYCEEDGCRLIDVAEALLRAGSAAPAVDLRLPDGVNFSAQGHRAIAAAIAANLEFR